MPTMREPDSRPVKANDARLKAPNVEIIDINSFLPTQKYIVLGYDEGGEPLYHPISQITVQTRLRILALQRQAEQNGTLSGDADEEKQQAYAIEMIHCMVPTLSRETLEETPYSALMPLLEYCLKAMTQQGDEVLAKAKNALAAVSEEAAEAEAEPAA